MVTYVTIHIHHAMIYKYFAQMHHDRVQAKWFSNLKNIIIPISLAHHVMILIQLQVGYNLLVQKHRHHLPRYHH